MSDDTVPPIPEPVDEEFVKPNPGPTASSSTGRSRRRLFGKSSDDKTPPRVKNLGRKGQFEKPLAELYVGIGTMMLPFDPICAETVINQAPQCAKSLDELAYQNEAVRKILEGLLTTSAFGMVIVAHAPIILTAMMHHSPAMQDKLVRGFGDNVEHIMKQGNRQNGGTT